MTKNYSWTKAKYKRFLKEKRGQGTGKDYKPWYTIRDVPSEGRSSMTLGWKTGRTHHLLSLGEKHYLYFLDWADDVVDIWEQYPLLDTEDAMAIATEAGISYPISNIDQTPHVLTTDFLITKNIDGQVINIARTVKKAEELDDPRVIEKLEIERRYWQKRGIDWGIVTEDDFPQVFLANLYKLRGCYVLDELGIAQDDKEYYCSIIKTRIATQEKTLRQICSEVDSELVLAKGMSFRLITHMIARKEILINMDEEFGISMSATQMTVV